MNPKKLTALLLALLILSTVLLCSCGQAQTDDDESDDPSEGSTSEDEVYDPYPYDDLTKFMDLPSLENITVSQSEIDDSLKSDLSQIAENNSLYVKLESGTAEKWHKTVIDFVGTINGEVFSGGTGSNYSLVLGSGTFVPGFEEGVIGMEIGEVKPITFNFPENYYEDMAGKEVTFTVTLKELYALPEITDEFCEAYTYFKTTEEFYENARLDYLQTAAYDILLERCELKERPEKEYTEYYQGFITYFSSYSQQYGMALDSFLAAYGDYFSRYGLFSGITVNEFYTVAENYAVSNTVNDLLLYSLVRHFDLKTEGEEFEEAKAILLTDGGSYEALVEEYGSTAVITSIMNIQVLNRLTEYVTVK